MNPYDHNTELEAYKRFLIDCIHELTATKTELSANKEELISARTQLFDIKNEQFQTKTELLVTKQELHLQNILIKQLATRPSPILPSPKHE